MSKSNPSLINPAQHFFEWKAGEGRLEFYDKEKQQRIPVPLPFEFLPIDQLSTITGYSKPDKAGYYSNEIRNSVTQEFIVKMKGNTVYAGLYKNSQGIPQVPRGASFAKSVYIVHKTRTGEFILGNIKMSGSALSAWIEFTKTCVPENGKVIMHRGDQQEAATGPFFPPTFEYVHETPEENVASITLDKQLQIYLNQYFAATQGSQPEPDMYTNNSLQPEADPVQRKLEDTETAIARGAAAEDEAATKKEFTRNWNELGKNNKSAGQAESEPEPVITDLGDEPINLDDIPF